MTARSERRLLLDIWLVLAFAQAARVAANLVLMALWSAGFVGPLAEARVYIPVIE